MCMSANIFGGCNVNDNFYILTGMQDAQTDTHDVDNSLWYLYRLETVNCILYVLLICDCHKRNFVISILYLKRFFLLLHNMSLLSLLQFQTGFVDSIL